MWADAGFPDLARQARSSAILAAARNGTVGMPVVETACAPFRHGRWLFSHNGVVAGWPASVERLAAALPVADLLVLDAPTDSAVLWALVRRRLLDGVAPEKVVESVTTEVGAAAHGSRLNLLLTDGETVAASTWGHSLSVREAADHVVVASEPFGPDPSAWDPVPDRHLVVADSSRATVRPLS